ncbi:MAG TPA: energy-coupling factor transporter transmembrane component T [Bacteroidales bacterium]|nr:energy-coupling factor transporter transmembrane component T [Bacteroidales bacterium]
MIPPFLRQPNDTKDVRRKPRAHYITKTLLSLVRVISLAISRFYLSEQKGLLQRTPEVLKVWMMLTFLVVVSVVHRVESQLILLAVSLGLSLLSQINFWNIVRQALLYVLLFGLLITLPASLNVFNGGKIIFSLVTFEHPHRWWIYSIPKEIGITREGLEYIVRICLKILNSVSFVLLILSTTGFENVIRGLRSMRIPHFFLLVLTLAYKYIVILSQQLYHSFQAMSLRGWNRTQSDLEKEIAAGRIGFLFRKGWEHYDLTYKAMIARGFTGEFKMVRKNGYKTENYLVGWALFVMMVVVLFFDRHG